MNSFNSAQINFDNRSERQDAIAETAYNDQQHEAYLLSVLAYSNVVKLIELLQSEDSDTPNLRALTFRLLGLSGKSDNADIKLSADHLFKTGYEGELSTYWREHESIKHITKFFNKESELFCGDLLIVACVLNHESLTDKQKKILVSICEELTGVEQ